MRIALADRAVANVLVFLLAATLAVAGGILAGYGEGSLTVIAAGCVVGAFLLLNPALSLWVVIVGGLVVAGLAQLYLPQLQLIRWGIALLAWAMGGIAILQFLLATSQAGNMKLPAVWWWMLAFAGVAALSSALNYSDKDTLLYGLKGHFQVWGLFVAIMLMRWSDDVIDQFPRVLVGIGLVQLPFVLHQYLFLVPARVGLGGGVVAEDVVAGTLGATAGGGGANAVLSLLLIIAASILLAKFKRGLISPLRLCSYLLVLMLPIVLNSNRIALIYLLLVYVLLFSAEIFRATLKAIFVACLFGLILAMVSWSYMNFSSRIDPSLDWRSFVAQAIEQNTEENYGYGGYQLNRLTSLTFWAHEHRRASWDKVFLGHGAGASREAEGGAISPRTLAQLEYAGVGIGLTTVSAILWDTGIVGFACWLAVLWSAYLAAGRAARHYDGVPARAAALRGFQVAIPILFISFFHKSFLTFHLPYQTLVLLVLSYIAYWQMRARADDAARASRHSQVAVAKETP